MANGLPNFSLVGLADTEVREARERVRSAINYADYVKLSNGSSSFLQVDLDGLGAGTAVQTITLTSVNLNTDLATLVNNKVIVV
jgi:hypothetical protein